MSLSGVPSAVRPLDGGFEVTLAPIPASKMGPMGLVLLGTMFGLSGPFGFGLDSTYGTWPRIADVPIFLFTPFVGAALLIAGAFWWGAIRDRMKTVEVKVEAGRLSVDHTTLTIDRDLRARTKGNTLTVKQRDSVVEIRSADRACLDWLEYEIRKRAKAAGSRDAVPAALAQGREAART